MSLSKGSMRNSVILLKETCCRLSCPTDTWRSKISGSECSYGASSNITENRFTDIKKIKSREAGESFRESNARDSRVFY